MLRSFLSKLKPEWLIAPTHCLLCLTAIKHNSLLICKDCLNDLPTIDCACDCCGLPIPHHGLCGQCIKQPPFYTKIIAPYRYEFPIAPLITRFKYHQQWPIGHLLAELLISHLQTTYETTLSKPDYLLAVPLSKQRLKQRGFNQADLLSKWLSKKLAIPLANKTLQKVIDTPTQHTLSAKARAKNLKNAFRLTQTTHLANAHLAIIDDVVTTGSTANTIAQLLQKAGAKRVDIYALARTPHFFK